jgi:LacI family transcriptional regulator
MSVPTIRSLAAALRLSPTTVSDALRGLPRVNSATASRVLDAAKGAGYRVNPLTSAVMSKIRRSHNQVFRGVLAAVKYDMPGRPYRSPRFLDELVRGATDRAGQLGFDLQVFNVDRREVPLRRLDSILKSRGIRGIILLPTLDEPNFHDFDWSRYVGVYTDYIIEKPALHSVCSDNHPSILRALKRLHALGYRRPGMVLNHRHAERLRYICEGAFLTFQRHMPSLHQVPPLLQNDLSSRAFATWFRQHNPDVVLGHDGEVMTWMERCGADIPETHGFFCLNLSAAKQPCAGLDRQPELQGAHAAEIVIEKLQRNEIGIPALPTLTSIPARWVEGPTIRAGVKSLSGQYRKVA